MSEPWQIEMDHLRRRIEALEDLIKAQADALAERDAAIERVRGVIADKYVGPPTEYGEGFQNGYNDALGVVERALDGESLGHVEVEVDLPRLIDQAGPLMDGEQ